MSFAISLYPEGSSQCKNIGLVLYGLMPRRSCFHNWTWGSARVHFATLLLVGCVCLRRFFSPLISGHTQMRQHSNMGLWLAFKKMSPVNWGLRTILTYLYRHGRMYGQDHRIWGLAHELRALCDIKYPLPVAVEPDISWRFGRFSTCFHGAISLGCPTAGKGSS